MHDAPDIRDTMLDEDTQIIRRLTKALTERSAELAAAIERAERAERERDELREQACRYYLADGSFKTLSSPEAVIERRKGDARRLAGLRD